MGNINFDTTRFIETSSPRQLENGTTMFMDSHNPGVYYSANRNGNVNRIIKTTEQTISTASNQTTTTDTRKRTRYTKVNYRQSSNGKFIPLHRLNDQLRRIQQVAQNYDSSEITSVFTSDTDTIVVTPR
tara:strand:+ start:393 stop:779 length:387 start_codon:yes stop_codon:yes gene_type:complete